MRPENTPQEGSSEPLLTVDEAAAIVGLSPFTLDGYRAQGRGPEHRSVDGRVAYRRSDLEAWIAETDGLLTTAEAAKLVGFSESHFRNLRTYGTGPAFIKLKGQRGPHRVFYRPNDVIAWRDAR
jgi:predicted DNA-binding transcriptional regulator AlpA